MTIQVEKLERAIRNMEAVEERLVAKLGTSTTGAQAHIGLLTECRSDLAELYKMLPAPAKVTPVKASKAKDEG